MTSMPPPWEPDDEETQETRILPPEDETRVAPPPRRPEPARVRERVVLDEGGPPTDSRERPPRGGELWPWLLLLLGLALALLAALWWFSRDDDAPQAAATKPVPSVVRLEVADARGVLTEQGFAVEVLRKASDEAAKGVVFAQRPQAGTRLREGATVTITASVGPASATVPDVVGMTADEAAQALADAGLRPRPNSVPSAREQGTVVAQAPKAGEEVKRDSVVRINVSGGPGTVAVPDVTGAAVEDATAELEAAGLRVATAAVDSDEPEGTVTTQDPNPGAEARRGATVRLGVSKGPATQAVAVPDVTGLSEEEARAQLESLGLRVRVVRETAPDATAVGTVLRQVPAAAREVPPGTQVTIVVGA